MLRGSPQYFAFGGDFRLALLHPQSTDHDVAGELAAARDLV